MYLRKTYLFYLVVFCVLILGLASSVDAFTIQDLDKNTVTYMYDKSTISVSIVSSNFVSDNKMKKDLNSINKIVVKVNNKTVNIIKKGGSWSKNKHYPTAIIDRKTIVKGNIKGKTVSILVYGKKNKLIDSKTNKVESVYYLNSRLIKSKNPKDSKLTYNQARRIFSKNPNVKGFKYRGYYYIHGNLCWSFEVPDKYRTILTIDDKTGILEFGGL
jgi:hypothetical protein